MEESEKTAFLAIIVNLGVFTIKIGSAAISGSLALKAEAFHSFADFIAVLTAFAGLKIAKRKTRAFPYGLYKIENLIALFMALVIFYSGYEIILEVIHSETTAITHSGIAVLGLLCAMMLTLWFFRYEKRVGERIGSPILLADAAHAWTHLLNYVIVLIAVISSTMGFPLDKIAALIMVGFIARTGFQIMKDGAKVLLDASVDYETLRKAEKIIRESPQVMELKSLKGRNSGRFMFIEAEVALKTHDLDKAFAISGKIEKQIKGEIEHIDQVRVYYEPMGRLETIYALPLDETQETVSAHFGEADGFMIATVPTGEKIPSKVEILKNPHSKAEKGKGILAAEFLAEHRVNTVLLKQGFESKGPSYVFSDANIEILLTEAKTPRQAFAGLGIMLDRVPEQPNAPGQTEGLKT